LNKAFLA